MKQESNTLLSGNTAAAYAVKLCGVEVIPIYPITPQTAVVEKLSEFIQGGDLTAELIHVESEHSAMAAAIAAEAMGARSFTASSSQGLCYMHENLFSASGLRMPIVMAIVNRAITMPISIGPDQGDSLAQRDTGWLQIYAENAQEVLDTIIQAYRIAEDPSVLLPTAVCYDGLLISHFYEPVQVPAEISVRNFVGEYKAEHIRLDPKAPVSMGVFANEAYVTEYRYQQYEAMENAKTVIETVDKDFYREFGRSYGGLLQNYKMDDAEVGIMGMGSICEPAKKAADRLREKGIRAGVIRLRTFRPFPKEKLRNAAGKLKLLIVLDRDVSQGSGGIVYGETCSALISLEGSRRIINFILGLSGREVPSKILAKAVQETWKNDFSDKESPVKWIDVRL